MELITEKLSESVKITTSTTPLEAPKTRWSESAKETGSLSEPKKTRSSEPTKARPKKTRSSEPAKARLYDTVKTAPLDPAKRTERLSEAKKTTHLAPKVLSSEPAKARLSESANTSVPQLLKERPLGSTKKLPQVAKKSILEAAKAGSSEAAKTLAMQQNGSSNVVKTFSSVQTDNTQQTENISSINCHDDAAGIEDSLNAVPDSLPVDFNLPSQNEEYIEMMDTDQKSKSNVGCHLK